METTNLSKIRRDKMLKTISEIKKNIVDEETLTNLSMIENELTKKKYGLIWEEHEERVDKELETQIPTFEELKDKEIISNPDDKFNFLLEGDNLHSLYLLEKTHTSKIDVIYIDPPYNTGSDDFIYNDKIIGNDDSFIHSKWLSFMEKRLLLAKELLSSNGTIYISIGEQEFATLKLLCDDIFGEKNFVTNISRVMKSGGGKGINFSPNIDYILVYAKNIEKMIPVIAPVSEKSLKNYYKFKETEGRHVGELYGEERIFVNGLDIRPNQRYYIKCPDGSFVIPKGNTFPSVVDEGITVLPILGDGCWKWTYETYKKALEKNEIVFKQTKTSALIDENGKQSKYNLYNKVYLDNKKGSKPGNFIIDCENRLSSTELKKLDLNFSFAKPSKLISYLINLNRKKDSIILDFFAGSGTTAQAVLELNKADNGNRKFILCTNNENSICEDITYQRIKSVITGKRKDESKYSDGIKSNLKYYRCTYIPRINTEKENLHNNLLINIKNLIQLENGIEIDDNKIKVYLSEVELDKFSTNQKELEVCEKVYISSDILLTTEQEKIFEDNNIEVYIIPEYYFEDEIMEVM